jgi:hypothetical protein
MYRSFVLQAAAPGGRGRTVVRGVRQISMLGDYVASRWRAPETPNDLALFLREVNITKRLGISLALRSGARASQARPPKNC